ncbi:MAG: 5'-deoxynucleotidase, partial [Oscillospiraceae bacterium]|nr:5'-deoxynucleotidase [Oscillospiraceae bacterium]
MNSSFFAYIGRMRYITRWALMRNTDSENVQEHSHMVAVLAHALAVIGQRLYGREIDAGQVAVAALYHDAS